ncbi:MAG: helix-hairpin-helix domain-containing protein [Anaerovoracaceae bacterium]
MEKYDKILNYLKDNQKIVKMATVVFVIIVAVLFFVFGGKDDEALTIENGDTIGAEEQAAEDASSEKIEYYVDISGNVKAPGVYLVDDKTRLFQVVKMAGGFTRNADLDAINQAEIISDGQKIVIPSKIKSNGENSEGVNSSISSDGKININNGDMDQLQEIPGVGPSTAQKIIDYRTENGRFTSKEDLKNISGIGDKTYEKLEDKIKI